MSLKEVLLSFLQIIPDLITLTVQIIGCLLFSFISPLLHLINLFKVKQFPSPKTIVITGASSGIGRSLAIQYADKGKVIAITGRNRDRLNEVAKKIADKGAIVEIGEFDVSNRSEMSRWLLSLDKRSPVDLVIANAGTSEFVLGDEAGTFEDRSYQIVETNVLGVLNTINPLLPIMRQRKHGQIVIVGSMSTYFCHVLAHYVASKCWVHGLATTLRKELVHYGVGVTLLTPGFVQTGMTTSLPSSIKTPMIITADQSAAIFKQGISENRAQVIDNFGTSLIGTIVQRVPLNLKDAYHVIAEYIYPSGEYDIFAKSDPSSSSVPPTTTSAKKNQI
ncbi:short-chain dehydrogenase/reductase family protein [Cavenderia fasciculata]|uniref:Short-chain dehydrogenase/reductase family protein n=1 Tax=Cavenderia fasciculata TaxID=261658 RepID=F4PVN4_CACFS|nr:short-chain dehydrogenase/reductase family protein [Cavenderia fasciculata]EGG20048.1 short-chain dehydrogenase/reductase family protein [Cavenderia fasciculata]|eukprot:XP_004367031.1 short-chain dehydrogenase/reductase family protein [Cavenderia fasciculata]